MTVPTKNVDLKLTKGGTSFTNRTTKTRNVMNPRGVNMGSKNSLNTTNKTTGTILSPRSNDRKQFNHQPTNSYQTIGNLKPQPFEYP